MKKAEELRAIVREKYGRIAEQSEQKKSGSCCGGGEEFEDYTVFSDDYSRLEGYVAEADLSLGCGLPTEFARIHPGDTVVDLGSGAGNDCFVAQSLTGPEGKVIGVDMTEAMVDRARRNVEKLGYDNVEMVLGEIEDLPLNDEFADVVVSNCVFNLVPDKERAFAETLRILKPGGHFSISDIVIKGDLPKELKEDAELYAGCVAGAIPVEDYLGIIRKMGFKDIQVQKLKPIALPPSMLEKYLSEEEIAAFNKEGMGIFSLSVFARREK